MSGGNTACPECSTHECCWRDACTHTQLSTLDRPLARSCHALARCCELSQALAQWHNGTRRNTTHPRQACQTQRVACIQRHTSAHWHAKQHQSPTASLPDTASRMHTMAHWHTGTLAREATPLTPEADFLEMIWPSLLRTTRRPCCNTAAASRRRGYVSNHETCMKPKAMKDGACAHPFASHAVRRATEQLHERGALACAWSRGCVMRDCISLVAGLRYRWANCSAATDDFG
jgi:hypothetical protein